MNFNKHSKFEGLHAFLSPSQYHWLRYTDEKLLEKYETQQAALLGTRLHEFASDCIQLGQKLPKCKKTLNSFVNDAIGYRMTSEQTLVYSENCFGTADAISFDEKKRVLRIHDLKTGRTPAKFDQLMIYAAMFCLEYNKQPEKLDIELRIYQNDEVVELFPEPQDVRDIMDIIVRFDKIISNRKMEDL